MRPSLKSAGWKSYCLFLLLLVTVLPAVAQPPAGPTPQTVPELLDAIEKIMERQKIPGLMISLVTRDSVIFSGGLGYSHLAAERKVDGRTKFRLGSTTKMMVAMGILHLVHEGKIALDAKLADIAPEVPFHNRWEETHPVRIINLLEHTAGLTDAFMNKTINLGPTDRRGIEVLQFYKAQLETRIKPGTMPAYANINYTVLGYVIESVSGMEWPEYLRRNVLLPIDMDCTDFKMRIPQDGGYAQGYYTRDGTQVPVPASFTLNSNGAHGSMNSCANDMAKLVRFFLNDWRIDTTAWLPPSYITDMETVHTTLAVRHGLKNGYGLGTHIEAWHPKSTFFGHGGSIQGFTAHMMYSRENGIGMAIAKNGGHDLVPIIMLIADFLTLDMPFIKPVEKEIPVDSIQPFLGYYKPFNANRPYSFIQNIVNDVSITMAGNELQLKPMRGWPLPLSHAGELRFRATFEHDAVFVFGHNENGDKVLMAATPAGGTHYTKTSVASVMFKRALGFLGALALLFSLFIGATSIILFAMRRLKISRLPLFVIPMLATVSLAVGLKPLMQAKLNSLSFTEPNGVTLTIFIGTILFGVFAVMGLWFLYARWETVRAAWLKALLTFTTVGIATIALVFLYHGMIGPMIWRW